MIMLGIRAPRGARGLVCQLIAVVASLLTPLVAQAALTVSPLTWNVVGLDSNNPNTGPQNFPIGARVCSDVATTNVAVNFVFDSANANVNLRPGSLSTINLASIGAGGCSDAYFEAQVTRSAAAYDTARRYHITATDGSGTYATATPRELYVEHLISQSRNSITDMKVGTSLGNLVSIPAGGSMDLIVGNTYYIQLLGGTATQGYEQFEDFINFPNIVFQILSVNTNYSADNSPYVPNPNDKLYADACLWQNDPNDPNYRACVGGDFKAGGANVATTYVIKIIGGGGTAQPLSTLLYDFSGSSYHYNGDFSSGARIANIIDPTSAGISKSFSPSTTSVNGLSVLSITLTNPNAGVLSGYNFVDNLPANMTVANPSGATSSGCGTPTLTATAGSSTISFSNGTLAANSNCVIRVNVTPSATGSLINTTNPLFIDSINTTHTATATLTVNNAPPPGTGVCGQALANWSVPNGTVANPPDLSGGVPTVKAGNVATATLAANVAGSTAINTSSGHGDTTSWGTFGYKNAGQYIQFTVDTSQYTAVQMGFWVANPSPANGPSQITVTANSGSGFGAPVLTISSPAAAFTQHTIDFTGLTSTSGNTIFRITATGANNDSSGASLLYDDMVFTGCGAAVKPTIAKAFSPAAVAVNGISTLSFTLTNPNSVALTSATFSDNLPAGVQVAATPSASTTCGGTWAPSAGSTTLNFSGGTIPASGSCTVNVNVTATTAGPHVNVSGFLSTTESGQNPNNVASATLTAVLPPQIAKQFSPSPIVASGVSTLTFTLTNPNQNDALAGVAFSDTFPTSPGAMVVAAAPNATTSGCGAPTFSPVAGAGSISFSGGSIAAGGTCIVNVNITAPSAGTYNNISGNVSHIINAQTVNGNTAIGSLTVDPPHPAIGLLKQVGPSAAGPWTPFLDVNLPNNVYYQFTIENTGDVPLSPVTLADNTFSVSPSCTPPATLPVAIAANNNHIFTCVVGPVSASSGSHINTATATGTFNSAPVSATSSATYATTGLTLAKSATESSFTLPGDVLHYSYLVTNNGFAPLQGPVTVSDNKTTVTCPAVSTVGDLDNYLDPGESITCTATYIVTAADVTAAGVTNTASATIDGVSSNNASKTVPLSSSADVSIDKTLTTSSPYYAGQSISYTLTVANAGPSTATNIQVTDTPSNLAITNVSGSGCASLPCTIASLASGANITINVTATINAAGAFDNSASVTATQPDPNTGNNTDNTNNGGTATDAIDLAVVKTFVTPGPYRDADVIQFNIAVTNNGPSTATNVVVVDHPVGLSVLSMSGGGCNGASVPGAHNQNVQCTIASMASGETQNVSVTASIDNPGQFTNDGIVSADQTDTNLANNDSQVVDVATTSADISIVKAITTPAPYYVGETVTYTLTVHNAGPSPAANVVVNDTPTNMTIQSVNVSGGNACASFPCTMIPAMVIGNTRTITVTATINSTGAFSNTASANGPDFDPDPSNNTSVAGAATSPSADLSVVKTFITPSPYRNADVIQFNIAITNNGPDTATNVIVLDHPVGLTVTAMSGGGCTGANPSLIHNANVQCTIASLANGATSNVTVTATIDNPGQFTNTASVTADQIDPNTSNNSSTAVDVATTSADVSIVKSINTPAPYYVGQTVTYTLTVHNAGPSPASFVVVNDVPTNMTIQSVTVNGGYGACASFPCAMTFPPVMVIGNTRTITVTATLDAVGAFSNTATANGNDFDPNTANNTSTAGGTALPAADLSLVKTLTSAGPYNPGQSINYSIVVANAGPSTATNVVVADTPNNLTITNVSGSGCAAMPCTIGSLASGANTTINVTATINAAGAFSNSAAVAATEFDPNSANNTSTASATTGPAADVSLVKTLTTAGPYSAGQSINYSIVVANAGPSTATNIVVTDTPTNLTITNVSGSGCAAMPCTIASLTSGANTTINVTATINAAGAFDNSATATAAEFDPNVANNTDNTGNGGTAGVPQLTVTKSASPAPFAVGVPASYTITVTNTGSATTSGSILVSDTLPTGITLTSASGTNWSCTGTTSLACTFASTLTAGASTTLTLNVAVGPTTTTANNSATGSGGGDSTCPAAPRCTGTVLVSVVAPNLTTSKTGVLDNTVVSPSNQSNPGDRINYTITVTNSGNGPATGVTVTDPKLPSLSCTIGGNPTTLPATIPAASALTCTGAYTLTGVDISNTSVTNTATVSGQNVCTTPSPSCSATHVTSLVASPRLTLTKTASSNPFVVGQPASYTITVTNSGSTATTAAINVADNLPTGITLASAVGTGWICTGTTNLTCTFAGVLNPSASTALTLNVNVSAAATTGTNTATVSGGGDPACPAASQCSGTVVVSAVTGAPPAPVPGDARWAMWLLGLALLASAARMAERRRE